jgi:hypothetical protein
MFGGKTPDITAAQLLAVAGWIAAQAVAYGWLTSEQSQLVLSSGATIVAAAWKIADSLLRGNRAKALAANPNALK